MNCKNTLLLLAVFCSGSLLGQNASIAKGNEFYRQSQYDLAEQHYRKAVSEAPASETARFNLANALYRQKKYKEAVAVLNELEGNSPTKSLKSAAFYNEGVVHTKSKDLEKSIEAYKSALRLNPDDEQARENLQKALREQKKQKQQQQKDRQDQKNRQSSMSQKEAEQKLKRLQEKEKGIQQRMQKKNGTGTGMSNDW